MIFTLKNIVIVILAAEFTNQLMSSTKYKKYINLAISLIITGFLITTITGTSFDIFTETDFNYIEPDKTETLIMKEYKNKIAEKIAAKFPKNELPEIEIEVDENYNLTHLKVITNYEKAEQILTELGFTDYEIVN